jgi:LPPG:FO 2-phospho-L-lactate transferase
MNNLAWPRVVVLAGGVGGAKLADGFAQILPPGQLSVVVNTGDDFTHLGLTICPDLDTVLYTLAGVANPTTGWGRAGESWRTLAEVERLGGPAWFRLGDLDMATHLTRAHLLEQGQTLTEVTHHLAGRFGILPALLPMCNEPAPTLIESDEGMLAFQTWFVEKRWGPAVKAVQLPADVRTTANVLWALERAELVVFAPSNPFVSIDPILNAYPIREMVADLPDLVVAVSPIIGGAAVKGPAAKMMRELGMPVTAQAIAEYYHDLIDIFVYDRMDDGMVSNPGYRPDQVLLCTQTLMENRADRAQLAQTILDFCMEKAEG